MEKIDPAISEAWDKESKGESYFQLYLWTQMLKCELEETCMATENLR